MFAQANKKLIYMLVRRESALKKITSIPTDFVIIYYVVLLLFNIGEQRLMIMSVSRNRNKGVHKAS
ncbi:hypothetical protein KNP414_03822 [Paenibacillus mucilaginosus KNP414]|uniref:Uncharacterized protein n=1 Tax=Paenibacillus mucilaginosus (strain KNP414) TaxID=1036673 RepID=F8F687_PAEMK|nr:hypothetical protein KNP414_03822 [Paenibacillus mucilaginosus KNP414]